MSRTIPAIVMMMCAATACSGAALAHGGSFTPPAGQAPATAPGGLQGQAGPRNVSDAVRSGQAVGVPRRRPNGFSLPRGRDSLPIPGRF